MKIGWEKINGCWYYFNGDGVMLTGTQKIDGVIYNFKDNGMLIE
ncbi:hypothetical protein [Clostridium perfringens]|nr:hypothetical protein [Clostridium perfringens]